MSTTRPLTNDVTHTTLPSRDALYVSTTEKTFERDEYLPNLPIPPLDQTLKKYLESSCSPTYVTAATRQFYHGRTETLRSCTTEVMDWVHSMVEDTASSRDKLQYLHIAVSKFKNMMKDCTKNHGCDRHLLGLYMISVEEGLPVPDIFIDPSWIKSGGSGNFVLSTSCCGYTPISGCIMPMKENGYGTFYNIENNRFTFTIISFNKCSETSAKKFFQHIERALLSMEHLLTYARL